MNTGSPGKRFREAVATEAPLQVIGIITAYVARMGEAIETLSWQTFSREALDQALATGRPVFVDFTADWCLICKSNERFALDTAPVREAVSKKRVIMLRADWTRGDPVITEILKEHGRVGVPMYLYYPVGKNRRPVVLPELISSKTILDALNRP